MRAPFPACRCGLWNTASDRAKVVEHDSERIRAVLTNGSTGLNASVIAALPKLDIICALGAGYENIDVSAAKARNITITHGPGTNDTSVADHAMELLMAITWGIQVSVR